MFLYLKGMWAFYRAAWVAGVKCRRASRGDNGSVNTITKTIYLPRHLGGYRFLRWVAGYHELGHIYAPFDLGGLMAVRFGLASQTTLVPAEEAAWQWAKENAPSYLLPYVEAVAPIAVGTYEGTIDSAEFHSAITQAVQQLRRAQ